MSCAQVLSPNSLFDSVYSDMFSISSSTTLDRRPAKRQKIDSLDFILPKMSGYFFNPQASSNEDFTFDDPFQLPHSTCTQPQDSMAAFASQTFEPLQQQTAYDDPEQLLQQSSSFQPYQYQVPAQQQAWAPSTMPSIEEYAQHTSPMLFPQYTDTLDYDAEPLPAAPLAATGGFLSPGPPAGARVTRAPSVAESIASSALSIQSDASRGTTPNAGEMAKWGFYNEDDGTWSCAFPGCTSKSRFNRGCDLRKHYKRHSKTLFCRHAGCPQATEGGFSSKKDRTRHEAKHNPNIMCDVEGCGRMFSRQDNMKDHVRRVHKRRIN